MTEEEDRAPAIERAILGIEGQADAIVIAVRVREVVPILETEVRDEIFAGIDHVAVDRNMAPAAIETDIVLGAIELLAVLRDFLRIDELHLSRPVVVELKTPVNAEDRIAVVTELAVGIEHTDTGLCRNVAEHTKDRESGGITE